jgi:hypothetical protein
MRISRRQKAGRRRPFRKSVMIPLIALSLVASSGVAWAEGRYRMVEVYFDKIQVLINGQDTAPLSKESIIYNGSVYVPLKSLSELLGANVSWDNQTRSVNLDFIVDRSEELYNSSQQGAYQYVAFEYNQTMNELLQFIKTNNTEGMRSSVERFNKLKAITEDLKDENLAVLLEKMAAATELLRSGWQSKNLDEYYLAWSIFRSNAALFNDLIAQKISGEQEKR